LFSYRAYKARKYLAAIDWNFHLGLSSATNKRGNEITPRKYNQRTQQWDLRTVKQNKGYEWIPLLVARIFCNRMLDNDLVTRNVSLNASDPRLVAPTIAAKAPPSSKELIKRKSRFSLPSKPVTSSNEESNETPQTTVQQSPSVSE